MVLLLALVSSPTPVSIWTLPSSLTWLRPSCCPWRPWKPSLHRPSPHPYKHDVSPIWYQSRSPLCNNRQCPLTLDQSTPAHLPVRISPMLRSSWQPGPNSSHFGGWHAVRTRVAEPKQQLPALPLCVWRCLLWDHDIKQGWPLQHAYVQDYRKCCLREK